MTLTLLALACAPQETTSPPTSHDSASVDDSAPLDTTGLIGDRVDPQLPPPTFAGVQSSDGSARTQPDLVGHPTVVWFYPAAGTLG